MPKARIRPNPQLRKIVLEETNDGRDVIRYLKSVIMTVEDGVSLFGLRHKDYARSHKIAAARILARIGLEEGKRYLRRNYVRTPFRRVHPEDEDGPKRDMDASTAELYRLVKKETNDGRDIIIRFVGIMKGYHPEYKPHLRMAAAKELIRQIEFDYEEEPTSPAPTHTESAPATEPVGASLVGAHHPKPASPAPTHTESAPATEPVEASLVGAHHPKPASPAPTHTESAPATEPVGASLVGARADSEITDHHTNHSSESDPSDQANLVYPTNPVNPDSDKEPDTTAPIPNSQLKIENSTEIPGWIQDFANPYTQYAISNCTEEAESIYHSIIRRSEDRPDLDSARRKATGLIEEFNQFMAERDPEYEPVTVPDDLLTRSLTQRIEAPESYLFDPADFFDLDRDDFYYCRCRGCEECDELDYFFEFMRELEEDYDQIFEDP